MKYNLNEKIAERKTKEVYKDGDKKIKLFVPNYSKADILNEALIQSRVEEGSNLNIPKLIEVTKIDDRWALVSEHIEGKTLCEVINENKEDRSKYLELFVDIQLEVLSKNIPLLNKYTFSASLDFKFVYDFCNLLIFSFVPFKIYRQGLTPHYVFLSSIFRLNPYSSFV